MTDIIILIRNIFYRTFLIGLAFYLVSIVFWLIAKDSAAGIMSAMFGVSRQDIYQLTIYFIGWMKGIIFIFFLIPALALHWTGNVLKEKYKD